MAFTLVLLLIPVLALAGQCARLGAPARDRRLAAIRLAGGTPGQAVAVAAVETGLASLLGTVFGLGIFLIGRKLLHRPDATGQLKLPTDVRPSAIALAVVLLGLPLLATLIAALLLRRVVVTPFGVVRKARREHGPRPWPGVLIIVGLAAYAAIGPISKVLNRPDGESTLALIMLLLLLGGGLLATLGVVLGTGWLSYTAGRVLHRVARRPAALLAARRLLADPWNGSRTFAALLTCVIFGAGAAGVRAYFITMNEARAESQRLTDLAHGQSADSSVVLDDFYLNSMDIVDLAVFVAMIIAAGGLMVAVAESIASRRRAYAALVATGVPRAVLGRSIVWQSMAPAVPAILLALGVGVQLARGFFRDPSNGETTSQVCDASAQLCGDPATSGQYTHLVVIPAVHRAVAVPWADLALFGAGALAVVLVTVGVGLLYLRGSTALEELRVG